MIDPFGRRITYLRVSVTDRCNLRCTYCMPEKDVQFLAKPDLITFAEILEVVEVAAEMGVSKIRVTGGEPLLRPGVVGLVADIKAIAGIREVAMTTNGIHLAKMAFDLAEAGLDRVNISLDTMNPARYREITRRGDLDQVLAGLSAAKSAGLTPVKLNCVVGPFSTREDVESVRQLGLKEGVDVRRIQMMNFEKGEFSVVENSTDGDCRLCNRMRLSSDACIRPCLFSDLAYSIRELGVRPALEAALYNKPERGGVCSHDWMHGIGG